MFLRNIHGHPRRHRRSGARDPERPAAGTSWQDLKDHFRSAGTVVHAKIMEERPGRSKGWGIVEFEAPEEAVAAIEQLNDSDLDGRPIQVREDREDRDLR